MANPSFVDLNNIDDHQLFDPLHDFGRFSTCYDTFTRDRFTRQCGIGKMMFTFLTMYSHSGKKNDTFLQNYSNFTSFLGKIPSKLQPAELENSFMKNAVATATATASGTFEIIIGSRADLQGVAVCSQLEEFFSTYVNNGKIYLIVDTQKNLYGCIASNKEDTKFATVITRESIYDPANKLDINQKVLWEKKFKTNAILIETNGGVRRYNSSGVNEKTFGKFDIELSNILKINGADNVKFTIYDTKKIIIPEQICKLNSTPKHPNSIGVLNKEITKVMDLLKIDKACPTSASNFYLENEGFQNFTKTNVKNNLTNIQKLCGFFAQKRLGDALQAEVCIFSKKNPIICEDFDKKSQNVMNTVLVTIDRMLFAYAILRNVPVIYDDGKKYHCYKPLIIPIFTGGTDNKKQMQISRLPSSNIIQSDIVPQQNSLLQIKNNKYNNKYGGKIEIDKLITDDIIEELFIEPLLFFYILPFIFKYWDNSLFATNRQYINNLQKKYQIILNEIAKTDIFTVRSSTNDNDNNYLVFTSDNISKISDKYIFLNKNNTSYLSCKKDPKNIRDPTLTFNFHTSENSTYAIAKSNLKGLIIGLDDVLIENIQNLYNFEQIASDDTDRAESYRENAEGWSNFYRNTGIIALLVLALLAYIFGYTNNNSIKKSGGESENLKEFIEKLRERFKDMPAPILTEKLIQPINTTVLFSYLWMFRMYEVKVCFDDEQLKMDYDDCAPNLPGEYYVPTHKMPYFFFKRLIDDYEQQKDKISYLFIERILYELDSSLYTRINEIKYLVMMDDFVDDDVMNNTMLNKMIEANGELYKNTYSYVTQILGIITPSVNTFDKNIAILYNYPQPEYPNALFDYCIKKLGLNRYSFLYMYNDFTDNIFAQPVLPLQIKTGIDYTQEYPISPLEQPMQTLIPGFGGKKKKNKRKPTTNKRKNGYKRKTMKK